MRKALGDGRRVTLIGFSMGGVIASYLASVFDIRQLILCAPAFNPVDFSKIQKIGKNIITSSASHSGRLSGVSFRSSSLCQSRERLRQDPFLSLYPFSMREKREAIFSDWLLA